MNVKNNRLNRETDEKIIRAVYAMMTQEHRPIGKITVREICERTGIHRSTFYAHYRDVFDPGSSTSTISRKAGSTASCSWPGRRSGTGLPRWARGRRSSARRPRRKWSITACSSWWG